MSRDDTAAAPVDLLVVGDCNPDGLVLGDDVVPEFGQHEKLARSISLVIGGSAAITAVAAARLGLRVALAATIGADPAGEFMVGQLTSAGVDTSAVTVRSGRETATPPLLDGAFVDATGAGDCFNAGVIAGLLRGFDLPAAARLGCAVGSASTRAAGGTAAAPDLPTALRLAAFPESALAG